MKTNMTEQHQFKHQDDGEYRQPHPCPSGITQGREPGMRRRCARCDLVAHVQRMVRFLFPIAAVPLACTW